MLVSASPSQKLGYETRTALRQAVLRAVQSQRLILGGSEWGLEGFLSGRLFEGSTCCDRCQRDD